MEYDGGHRASDAEKPVHDGRAFVWPHQPGYETAAVDRTPVAPEAVAPPAAEADPEAARWEDDGGSAATTSEE